MGWNVSLVTVKHIKHLTHEHGRLLDMCGAHPFDLHGKTGEEAVAIIEKALSMALDPDYKDNYMSFEGTPEILDNCIEFLAKVLVLVRQNPAGRLEVH